MARKRTRRRSESAATRPAAGLDVKGPKPAQKQPAETRPTENGATDANLAAVSPAVKAQMREMLRGMAIMGTVVGALWAMSHAWSQPNAAITHTLIWTMAGAMLGLMSGRIIAYLVYAPPRLSIIAGFGFAAGLLITGQLLVGVIAALLGIVIGTRIKPGFLTRFLPGRKPGGGDS